MMKWFFTIIISISFVIGALNGRMAELTNAVISDAGGAVTLAISLMGSMCLWNGLMRVAQKSGLTDIISKILSPITCFLFKGVKKTSKAMQCITMNLTANLLGLGNAATPLGISAMQELAKLEPDNKNKVASNNMVMLVVMNTASMQLVPTTIATLRHANNSLAPMEIMPAIIVVSALSLVFGVTLAKILGKRGVKK
ncbi:MAG: spore maturation protein A [Oscillospiraceae bacterium]